MNRVKFPIDEIDALRSHSAKQFTEAIERVIRGIIAPAKNRKYAAVEELAALFGQTLTLADLMGRRRILLESDARRSRTAKFSEDDPYGIIWTSPVVPNAEFPEAVDDLLSREPRLAVGYQDVQNLYATRHAFALAKSTDIVLTKRVQQELTKMIREGEDRFTAQRVIARMGGWSNAYAETVYRTNLATAYSAGRFRQLQDPDVAEIIGALEYNATGDADTRPGHQAAHGLIALPNDPIWHRWSPPAGFQCRCETRLVDAFEIERRGIGAKLRQGPIYPSTFASAHPDKGFGNGRPDRKMYSR